MHPVLTQISDHIVALEIGIIIRTSNGRFLQCVWVNYLFIQSLVGEDRSSVKVGSSSRAIGPIHCERRGTKVLENLNDLRRSSDCVRSGWITQHVPHYFERLHVQREMLCASGETTFEHVLQAVKCHVSLVSSERNASEDDRTFSGSMAKRNNLLVGQVAQIGGRMRAEFGSALFISDRPQLKVFSSPGIASEKEVGIRFREFRALALNRGIDLACHCLKHTERMFAHSGQFMSPSLGLGKSVDCKSQLKHHRKRVAFVPGKRNSAIRPRQSKDFRTSVEGCAARDTAVRNEHQLFVIQDTSCPSNGDSHCDQLTTVVSE